MLEKNVRAYPKYERNECRGDINRAKVNRGMEAVCVAPPPSKSLNKFVPKSNLIITNPAIGNLPHRSGKERTRSTVLKYRVQPKEAGAYKMHNPSK